MREGRLLGSREIRTAGISLPCLFIVRFGSTVFDRSAYEATGFGWLRCCAHPPIISQRVVATTSSGLFFFPRFRRAFMERQPIGADLVPALHRQTVAFEKLTDLSSIPFEDVLEYWHENARRIFT